VKATPHKSCKHNLAKIHFVGARTLMRCHLKRLTWRNAMDTQQMMKMALDLAGLDAMPGDTAILVPGGNVRRVLMGVDMDTPELLLARQLGFDCVVTHHPRNTSPELIDVMDRHLELMAACGVPAERAREIVEAKKAARHYPWHSQNTRRSESAARLLGMPFLCIHSPADYISERRLQRFLDERFAGRADATLGEVVDSMEEIDEYRKSVRKPVIRVGGRDSPAGKILVSVTGLTNLGAEGLKAYFDAGVGTVIHMHLQEKEVKAAAEWKSGNVIVAGHMSSDSIGLNEIARAWEAAGLEVTAMSGIVR